jgi:hypothetical protein
MVPINRCTSATIILGLLFATQALAGRASLPEEPDGKPAGDHHSLAIYYEEQAQLDRTQAEEWDFLANHHETFQQELGALNVADQIARCRTMAEDFRNLEKWHHKLALKHMALMRKDVIP